MKARPKYVINLTLRKIMRVHKLAQPSKKSPMTRRLERSYSETALGFLAVSLIKNGLTSKMGKSTPSKLVQK
jgi:hypothetical protein